MDQEYNIAWEMFMTEEQEALKKLIAMGERDNIAQGVIEMTPQKEVELQKLANLMRPFNNQTESEAKKEWLAERKKQGKDPDPQSPEEEAELQKMLDEEQKALQEKYSEKIVKQVADLEGATKKLGRPKKEESLNK